jgi:type IV pilus assembly protein PilC
LEVEADTPEAAHRDLESRGLFVFETGRRSRAPALPRLTWPSADRIPPRALLVFNQELLALVKAGLPILTALDLLRERSQQIRLRSVLQDVRDAVAGGAALSAALARHPKSFSPLYAAALRAGEESGNFVDAVARYVEYQKRMLSLRQRFRSALSYPAILCAASGAVIVFLLTFVVPSFTRIYGDMEAQLPAATRWLVATTGWFRDAFPLLAAAAAIVSVAAWRWRDTARGRHMTDQWTLHLPWAGSLVRGYLLSRFARTLAMMLAGGIPIIPSLETTLGTMGNAYVAAAIQGAIPQVAAGRSLADALEGTAVVPSLMIELVAVGEKSGSLGDMLAHAADLYDTEMDTRLATLTAVIEPAIMIGMGGIVAVIVVIMYLPIFHLAAVVH